jgi:2-octaprenyl-6-methoxyphenol hydroxylase
MPITAAEHYDVVIVGAGMVGASLANALASNPQRRVPSLLVVEASTLSLDEEKLQPGFDIRSTVLSATTAGYFQALGIWPHLAAYAEPIRDIHVSDQGRFGTVRLDSEAEGVPALGYVTENRALGLALNRALLAKPDIELCAPVTVKSISPCATGMQLQLSDATANTESSISAGLVVLADGGRSGLPGQLGIMQHREKYGQGAIIANVAFSKPHQGRAWERFTPKGPLALLPLADFEGQHRAALVWTHPENAVDAFMALEDADFLAALQQDFGNRVGRFTRVGKRAVFPLALTTADEQIRPGLVLLGNVAHTLHPVAGQGFNLALRDTMALAENILTSVATGTDPGDFNRLQAYLAEVGTDQLVTTRFSDYMTRMFSSSGTGMTGVRHLGMACIDLLPPLRNMLSRQAMGLRQARVRL